MDQAEHAGTIILFDKRIYYTLPSETAKDLWALLSEGRTAAELVGSLHDQYEASLDVIAHDVAHHLTQLRAFGLVLEVAAEVKFVQKKRVVWWRLLGRGR